MDISKPTVTQMILVKVRGGGPQTKKKKTKRKEKKKTDGNKQNMTCREDDKRETQDQRVRAVSS